LTEEFWVEEGVPFFWRLRRESWSFLRCIIKAFLGDEMSNG
jgi:hypothetical protein